MRVHKHPPTRMYPHTRTCRLRLLALVVTRDPDPSAAATALTHSLGPALLPAADGDPLATIVMAKRANFVLRCVLDSEVERVQQGLAMELRNAAAAAVAGTDARTLTADGASENIDDRSALLASVAAFNQAFLRPADKARSQSVIAECTVLPVMTVPTVMRYGLGEGRGVCIAGGVRLKREMTSDVSRWCICSVVALSTQSSRCCLRAPSNPVAESCRSTRDSPASGVPLA